MTMCIKKQKHESETSKILTVELVQKVHMCTGLKFCPSFGLPRTGKAPKVLLSMCTIHYCWLCTLEKYNGAIHMYFVMHWHITMMYYSGKFCPFLWKNKWDSGAFLSGIKMWIHAHDVASSCRCVLHAGAAGLTQKWQKLTHDPHIIC